MARRLAADHLDAAGSGRKLPAREGGRLRLADEGRLMLLVESQAGVVRLTL